MLEAALHQRLLLSLLTPPLLQLVAVAAAALLLLYMALCYQGFHFHVAQVYARLGYPHAQHIVGQRYLQGNHPCQRTFVHREHKRGIVFYVLAPTLLLCFPLRSWSGEKRGPGHALVQVRCKKKKTIPDMVPGSFLGKSVGVWEEEKELVIFLWGEVCCTMVRARPSLSLAWGQDTSLCLPCPLTLILSQGEAKKNLEFETTGAQGK